MQTSYHELAGGVGLTCVKTEKFKTGCLSINLITRLSRENAAMTALLPRVLRRGCQSRPDMESLAQALDTLYGARIEPLLRKKGELHCVGFFADFPDDKFIPDGTGILKQTAELMAELLLHPALDDNSLLRADYVESERSNLVDDIRAGINDKRGYAVDRLLEQMCSEETFGVNRLGDETGALKITPEALTRHWKEILRSSKIEIFYCGTQNAAAVESLLRSALSELPERNVMSLPETEVILTPKAGTTRRFTEALDVQQGKLTIGFRLGAAMENPDYPALMVFNAIYGGNVTSKLFLNVREKLSLCYYASSMIEKHKGIMLVFSGVEFSKFEDALSEIYSQLESIKNGDISDFELVSAKRSVTTAIKSVMDRPAGLEDLYFDRAVAAVCYDPAGLCGKIDAVTAKEIAAVAGGIMADSVYFLTGQGGGELET